MVRCHNVLRCRECATMAPRRSRKRAVSSHRGGLSVVLQLQTVWAAKNRHNRGISPDDFARMLARQNGRCASCKIRPAETLCVDHSATKPAWCEACSAASATPGWDASTTARRSCTPPRPICGGMPRGRCAHGVPRPGRPSPRACAGRCGPLRRGRTGPPARPRQLGIIVGHGRTDVRLAQESRWPSSNKKNPMPRRRSR